MLIVVKGPSSYDDIKIVDNITYPTFREACFAPGFLADDKEYIEAIKEAKDWGSGHYLIKLFVTILLFNCVNNPQLFWQKTWEWLLDDIQYNQRKIARLPGTKTFILLS